MSICFFFFSIVVAGYHLIRIQLFNSRLNKRTESYIVFKNGILIRWTICWIVVINTKKKMCYFLFCFVCFVSLVVSSSSTGRQRIVSVRRSVMLIPISPTSSILTVMLLTIGSPVVVVVSTMISASVVVSSLRVSSAWVVASWRMIVVLSVVIPRRRVPCRSSSIGWDVFLSNEPILR